MKGKHAPTTGGSSGMGLAPGRAFLSRGANVVVVASCAALAPSRGGRGTCRCRAPPRRTAKLTSQEIAKATYLIEPLTDSLLIAAR